MMLKHFARVATFTLALAGAVALTELYRSFLTPNLLTWPAADRIEDAPARSPMGPNMGRPDAQVFYKTRLITLYALGRDAYTTLELERAPHQSAPEKLWVWTCFFVPSETGGRCWSDAPVELRRPFADGDRVTLTIRTPTSWYGAVGAPVKGFHAHVRVSTVSAEDARAHDERLNFNLASATPVVVEEPRAKVTSGAGDAR